MRALEGEARTCPTRGDERVSTIDGGSQADEPLIPSRRRRGGVHARATSHHIRQRRGRAGLLTGVPWVKNFGTLRTERSVLIFETAR